MPSDTDHCPHFSRGHCTVCLELASVGEALEVLQAELQRVRGQRDRLVEAAARLAQHPSFDSLSEGDDADLDATEAALADIAARP
jgi:hypothetical protein